MGTVTEGTPQRSRGTFRSWLAPTLLVALLVAAGAFAAAGPAGAATKPAKPTAKTPKGTVSTTKPTFKWTKAARAIRYELRVYKGGSLLFKKTGLRKRSWMSGTALPNDVDLTWKVRGKNARGTGAWSRSLGFKVALPPPPPPPPPPSSAKAITAFRFAAPAATGVITEATHSIALTVPHGTNVSALVATFTTTGASVKVGGALQTSGLTPNDFSGPVTYTVIAADTSTQDYVVTVSIAPLAIGDPYQGGNVAYILQSGDPGYIAGFTRGLIAATADQPSQAWSNLRGAAVGSGAQGTAIGDGQANTTAIVGQVDGMDTCTSGAAFLCDHLVQGGYSDWYLPSRDELHKLYDSRAALGGFQAGSYWSSSEIAVYSAWGYDFAWDHTDSFDKGGSYRVRAVRSFPAAAMTAFSFQDLVPPVTGVISQTSRTIALTVPFGNTIKSRKATFTMNGVSVTVGGVPQQSGFTVNDFTDPVTYTVTDADGTTQDYVVTVTVPLSIGDPLWGGKVAYILQAGDPGYVAGETHGLIAAMADQSAAISWSNVTDTEIGAAAQGTALGAGQTNTTAIVQQAGCTSGAAYVCEHLEIDGFDDWYLPSRGELNKLYLNRGSVGGFASAVYWSSSEDTFSSATNAWRQSFGDGAQGNSGKFNAFRVRAVRAF